jgi:hypothetical protein
MRMSFRVAASMLFLLGVLACAPATMDVPPPPPPPPPAPLVAQGGPHGCGDAENRHITIPVRVRGGEVEIDPQFETVYQDRSGSVAWVAEDGVTAIDVEFDRGSGLGTSPPEPARKQTLVKQKPAGEFQPCESHKYTIYVSGAKELDPIVIVRD